MENVGFQHENSLQYSATEPHEQYRMGSKQLMFLASIDILQGDLSIDYIEYLLSISEHSYYLFIHLGREKRKKHVVLPYHPFSNPWIKRQQPQNKNKLILQLKTNVWHQESCNNTGKKNKNENVNNNNN